jgi:integrase
MPVVKLTRTAVDRLQFNGSREAYFDTKLTGFGVRVNATGKTYFVHARTKAGLIKETIGKASVMDFDDAYTRAKKILDDGSQGILPAKQGTEAEVDPDAISVDITVQQIFDKYKSIKKLKDSTVYNYQISLDTYLRDWKDRPIRSITGLMVIAKHAEATKKSPARADAVMRVFRALCNFAIDMYDDKVMTIDPCRKLSVVDTWNRVGRKKTFLPAGKLKAWFNAVQSLGSDRARDTSMMLLFTGARLNEVCKLRWKDVDLEEGTVHFRDTKTGELLVPLCKRMLEMLKERKKTVTELSGYIFPGDELGTHYSGPRGSLQAVEEISGVHITPHDLRRTFLSYCEVLKVPVFTQKRLVSHALPQDVTEGYVQFTMEDLRDEVERVSSYIQLHAGIAEGGKVISIGTGKKAA